MNNEQKGESVQKSLSLIVMPAIYRFKFVNADNTCGWHRATELLEALRNIRLLQGKPPLTTKEITAKYPTISLYKRPIEGVDWPMRGRWLSTVSHDGVLSVRSEHCVYEPGDDWLGVHVEHDCYLPAKIGIELIKALKAEHGATLALEV